MDNLPLIDLHEDISYYYTFGASGQGFPLTDFATDLPGRHGDIPKFKRGNSRIIFSSIFPMISGVNPRISDQLSGGYGFTSRAYSPRAVDSTMIEHMKAYYGLAESYPKDLLIIRKREDVDESMRGDKTGFLIALEGAEALQDTNDIKILYNLGVRSVQFTWNFDTRYAATCMSKKDYGLTGEGEALLGQLNEYGMIADLSHASKRTCLDALSSTKLPAIVSHANAKAIFDVPRNLDDELLEALKAVGGVVGFIFATVMISKTPGVEDLAKHILYVYERFGPDMLAIGSDFFGLIDISAPKGLEDITQVSNLWNALRDNGMSEADLEKVAYRNALRVIEANSARWRDHV